MKFKQIIKQENLNGLTEISSSDDSFGPVYMFDTFEQNIDIDKTDKNFKKNLFYKRTLYHINLVRKYLQKISQLKDDRIDNSILENELMNHDESKFREPELTYYIHINYRFYLKNKNINYNPGKEIIDGMRKASFHHVKNNKHHPEYWDNNYTINSKKIDGTEMSLSYIACMLADWFAMDDELRGNIKEWIQNFIDNKCKFTKEQIDFIWEIVDKIYL